MMHFETHCGGGVASASCRQFLLYVLKEKAGGTTPLRVRRGGNPAITFESESCTLGNGRSHERFVQAGT